LLDLDIASLGETEIDPILTALEALRPEVHADIDGDFRRIHALAEDIGLHAILDVAAQHGEDLSLVSGAKPWRVSI
jgi:hypothetical protein